VPRLFAHLGAEGTTAATTRRCTTHRRHGLRNIRRHGFLIDRATLALLATTRTLTARRDAATLAATLTTLTTLAALLTGLPGAAGGHWATIISTLALAKTATGRGRRDWTCRSEIR
jgi:hypothetical protein